MSGELGGDAGGSAGRLSALGRRLSRAVEVVRGSDLTVRPFRPAVDGPLASFDPPAGHVEIERYWVNAPYAYVVITHDDAGSEHRHNVVEPALDDFLADLFAQVVDDIRDPLLYRSDGGRADEETLRTELEALVERYGVDLTTAEFHALAYYLDRDFRRFGRVDPLFRDPHIEDVSCDGYDLPSPSSSTTTRTPTSRRTCASAAGNSTTT